MREKKSYTPFPPAQTPSKIDLQLESGEYFLNEKQREAKKKIEKKEAAKEKSLDRKRKREAEFVAPKEEEYSNQNDDNDLLWGKASKSVANVEKKDKQGKKKKSDESLDAVAESSKDEQPMKKKKKLHQTSKN